MAERKNATGKNTVGDTKLKAQKESNEATVEPGIIDDIVSPTFVDDDLNLDAKVTVRNLAGWDVTFAKLHDGNGDVIIVANGQTRLSRNEINAQVDNNNKLFTGIDGQGTGARFIIDKRCRLYEQKIGKDVTNDTSNPVIVYRLTRSDSVLFDYQDSGHYEFLAYQDEQRDYDGYYVVDGKGYWICGKAKQADIRPDISKSLKSEIQCHSPIIYTDNIPQKFTALFYDKYENESDIEPQWSIDCDFTDKLDIQYDNKSVLISVNNSKLVNKTFKLCLNGDGYEEVSIQVLIRAFI